MTFHRRWLARELTAAGWHPGAAPVRGTQLRLWLQRLMALALFGRHAEATAAADVVAARSPADRDVLYICPRIYALAAGAVRGDQLLADRYAARAIDLLRKAVKAGLVDGELLRVEPDFDALRGRKDFKDLLADVPRQP